MNKTKCRECKEELSKVSEEDLQKIEYLAKLIIQATMDQLGIEEYQRPWWLLR